MAEDVLRRLAGRGWSVLLLVAAAAVLIRIAVAAQNLPPLTPDGLEYDHLARDIQEGRSYALGTVPTALRVPGYPLFVAAAYKVGAGRMLLGVVQALGDGITILLLGLVGRRIGTSWPTIWSAGAVVAVFPPLIRQPSFLLTESLYQTLLTASFAATIAVMGPLSALLAGLLWGATTLVRPTPFYFLFLLPVLLAFMVPRRRWLTGACFLAAALAVLTPWIARNREIIGAPTISTLGWLDIYHYNTPLASEQWDLVPAWPAAVRDLCAEVGWGEDCLGNRPELEIAALCRERAIALIREHPVRFVGLAGLKVLRLWGNVGYGTRPSLQSWAVAAFMLGVLTVLGVGIVRRRAWRLWPVRILLAFLIYNTAIHAISLANFRHNQPLLPLVFLFAAAVAPAAMSARAHRSIRVARAVRNTS